MLFLMMTELALILLLAFLLVEDLFSLVNSGFYRSIIIQLGALLLNFAVKNAFL